MSFSKDVREKLRIKEGDVIIVNTLGGVIIAAKRNPKVFREFKDFLPENFEKTLASIREDPLTRLKNSR